VKYSGPNALVNDINLSLQTLHKLITAHIEECQNHRVIYLNGLEDSAEVKLAIAVYLTGAIAACIGFNLEVRAALFGEGKVERELYSDVVKVIGPDNNISEQKKTYERNPWLWEGISHLLLHLSSFDKLKHPPAPILAKSSIHLSVNDHGLDIIALYGSKQLGITAGECKAYLERPGDAIADSAKKLNEVDKNLRDTEIRQTISQFHSSLPPDIQSRLVNAFWKDERSYFPMVCCDKNFSINWTSNRLVLQRLQCPPGKKHLVPVTMRDAKLFFDCLADSMRNYASGNI